MSARKLYYLGPRGTFTHQAAVNAAEMLASSVASDVDAGDASSSDIEPIAASDVPSIMQAVQQGDGWGVVAWENNVEGYVVPNLDMLIDASDAVGFARVAVNVDFDAFILPGQKLEECTQLTAHAHGLAQCRRFAAEHNLQSEPASSNAAACRDIQPGQVALGPAICGDLYGLHRVGSAVQDYSGGHTEFLVLARRDEAAAILHSMRGATRSASQAQSDAQPYAGDASTVNEYESVITFIPLVTGPGVLANLLDVLRDRGLNMTSFISRPIKGHDGTYSFIATVDAAPWESRFRDAIIEIVEHGDWVKTLAVYPRRERPNPPVDAWMLPEGGVRMNGLPRNETFWGNTSAARRELLW